ncbi:25842_t:CDS:2 [Gigaspora rosea]|nr:25842_t:CDS:2 [Gigaspora rosea]
MTRETKLKKFTRQLRSGNCDIAKVTNQYLEDTVKLLCRRLRRKEISENDHSIRIKEIENLKNETNQLQIQIKNLQDELNSLKDENRKLRQEHSNLHDTLIGICNNFGLIQINDGNENSNKQIQEKNQVVINLHRRIRKILEEYKQKYEQDSTGSSKITEIIEMEINEKKEWEKIEIPEILAEIGFHLDLKSLLAFSLVDKTTNQFIVSHIKNNQTFWRTYYNCNFPSYLTKEELYFLNEMYKTCQYCGNLLNDPVKIFELRIKICRQCIVSAFISRKELEEENYFNDFEENDPIKNLFMVIHSIDCYQLVGYYMDPSIRHSDFASHLLFFLRKDVDNALSEYKMLSKNLRSEWIEKKSNFVQEYQTRLLKMKHPLITDENIQDVLGNATFYFQDNYSLQDNLANIRANFS